jgi:hypothetical protein
LAEGDVVPDLELEDPNGAQVRISYAASGLPTMLYVLSPACIWCERNTDAINTLADSIAGRYRAIALSISSAKDVAALRPRLKLPIYTGIDDQAAKAYRLRSTPATLIIGTDNKIIRVWSGAFAGQVKTELEQFFDVSLPNVDVSQVAK